MDHIAAFKECYDRWSGWLGLGHENIPKNSIWYQLTEMMNNELIFQALLISGKKAKANTEFSYFLASNKPLYKYLLEGYLSFQYLAIRRLIEKYDPKSDKVEKKGVFSLCRLVEDMKNNNSKITREAFVCVYGLPYDYERLSKYEPMEPFHVRDKNEPNDVNGNSVKSEQRHLFFDRLSGVTIANRQPTDTIQLDYWEKCQENLNNEVFNRIKNFVNKYLAHAADSKSVAYLTEDDKIRSIQRIHEAQALLIGLFTKIVEDLYLTSTLIIPTYSEAQVLYNFDKPFVSKDIINQVYDELQKLIEVRIM